MGDLDYGLDYNLTYASEEVQQGHTLEKVLQENTFISEDVGLDVDLGLDLGELSDIDALGYSYE